MVQALQDFLKQNKESDVLTLRDPDTDFQIEKFKELVEDFRNSNEGSRPSWRYIIRHISFDSILLSTSTISNRGVSVGNLMYMIRPQLAPNSAQDLLCCQM